MEEDMKKRICSLLLSALMVLTLVPAALFVPTAAEGTPITADDLVVTDGLQV